MYTICNYNNYTYSAGMKEKCRDGCRTSLLIAGVVLVPAIFHTLLPPCHPYITIHFMEMIFSTCIIYSLVNVSEVFADLLSLCKTKSFRGLLGTLFSLDMSFIRNTAPNSRISKNEF